MLIGVGGDCVLDLIVGCNLLEVFVLCGLVYDCFLLVLELAVDVLPIGTWFYGNCSCIL